MIDKSLIKTCLMTIGFTLFTLFSQATAESRFETGFRGMTWGTHRDQLPDLGQSKKSLKKISKTGPSFLLFMPGKGNLSLELDGVPLLSIFMQFDNQNFHGVDMVFNNDFREKIKSVLVQEMESEGVTNDEGIHWQTANIRILLTDRELMVSHITP